MNSVERDFFKKLLQDKKLEIINNIKITRMDINILNSNNDVLDEADSASINIDNLIDESLSFQQKTELQEVEDALKKVETEEFGICEMCGTEISKERLKSKAFAKYCIECRLVYEKSNRI